MIVAISITYLMLGLILFLTQVLNAKKIKLSSFLTLLLPSIGYPRYATTNPKDFFSKMALINFFFFVLLFVVINSGMAAALDTYLFPVVETADDVNTATELIVNLGVDMLVGTAGLIERMVQFIFAFFLSVGVPLLISNADDTAQNNE